jgi:demethoxyubiquinone hydroxylase (CLK1/Coq7/Cat5 family)
MSGVEASKEPKEPQVHACSSCVKTVVQTFTHYHEQIAQLKQEKESLQKELRKLIEDHEEQKQAMAKEIRALEEQLAVLKKRSETHI